MQGEERLETTVRYLIDPARFGMTAREHEAARKQRRKEDWWLKERGMPPRSPRRSERFPWIEPRSRACFVPPRDHQEQRSDLFRFLEGKPDRRRGQGTAGPWKKLARALEAEARRTRQELECRERDLRERESGGEEQRTSRLLEDVARQIEDLTDLSAWKVEWLVALLDRALSEEAIMGDIERRNQRRSGLEFEMYRFELEHPAAAWRLVDEHSRVTSEPERTDLGARWALMLTLTRLGIGVNAASKISADLLLWFGIETKKQGHLWRAIKQWWTTFDPHLKG